MSELSPRGPFQPGYGRLPPYLAGRKREQRLFLDLLDALRSGETVPSDVLLYGPRGNGKTVLLAWLEDAIKRTPEVEVFSSTPSAIASTERLAERLLPDSWWKQFAPTGVSVFGVGINWRPGQSNPPEPEEALAARAQQKPFVMLLDEAHTLAPDLGRVLLNASQTVGRRHPFLLVLAGTPELEFRLRTMGASFWSRAEQLRVGRLDDNATAEAIRRPLNENRVAIRDGALARIVADTHGYPFFVQLWGSIVWRKMLDSSSEPPCITNAEVEAGLEDFRNRRDLYYLDRYEELRKRRLLPAARAVADAFRANDLLDDDGLDAAVGRGLPERTSPDEIEEAESGLRQLGYIWRPGSRPAWEPGIPSLMDYIRDTAPAPPDS